VLRIIRNVGVAAEVKGTIKAMLIIKKRTVPPICGLNTQDIFPTIIFLLLPSLLPDFRVCLLVVFVLDYSRSSQRPKPKPHTSLYTRKAQRWERATSLFFLLALHEEEFTIILDEHIHKNTR
jgi:hypothetical protein